MDKNPMMARLRSMALDAGDDSPEETALVWAIERIEVLEKFWIAAELAHEQEAKRIARLRAKVGRPLIEGD